MDKESHSYRQRYEQLIPCHLNITPPRIHWQNKLELMGMRKKDTSTWVVRDVVWPGRTRGSGKMTKTCCMKFFQRTNNNYIVPLWDLVVSGILLSVFSHYVGLHENRYYPSCVTQWAKTQGMIKRWLVIFVLDSFFNPREQNRLGYKISHWYIILCPRKQCQTCQIPSQGAQFFFSSISSAFSTKWIIFISYLVKSGGSHRLSGFQSSGYSFSTLSKWSLQSTFGMREIGQTWRILFLFLLIGGIVL